MATKRARQPICPSASLQEQGSFGFRLFHHGVMREAILVRFRGTAYGYINQCVHMPKALDCEHCHVFDERGESVRCTMHGITYDPATGACRSEICAGKYLTGIRIEEDGGFIYLRDKHGRMPE